MNEFEVEQDIWAPMPPKNEFTIISRVAEITAQGYPYTLRVVIPDSPLANQPQITEAGYFESVLDSGE